jgi:hypothetical protein
VHFAFLPGDHRIESRGLRRAPCRPRGGYVAPERSRSARGSSIEWRQCFIVWAPAAEYDDAQDPGETNE